MTLKNERVLFILKRRQDYDGYKHSQIGKSVIILTHGFNSAIVNGVRQPNGLRYPRWGGDGGTPSDWKNDKAWKKAWNRARIPSVGCTLCWAFLTLEDSY